MLRTSLDVEERTPHTHVLVSWPARSHAHHLHARSWPAVPAQTEACAHSKPLHAASLHACQRAWPARRVARAVSAGGRPSRTDFRVLVGRDTDFSADASPSLLGPAVPCGLTRRGPACACLSPRRERAPPRLPDCRERVQGMLSQPRD